MKYLIAGVSGSGKSTVRRILEKRGYRCIDIDKEPGLSNWYHKKTGAVGTYVPGIGSAWIEQHHWLWDEKKMQQLLAVDPSRPVFVCGITSDILDRFNLFSKVFLLQISPEMVRTRLTERPQDEFGKGEDEIAYTLSWQKEWEEQMLVQGAVPIDATQSPESVVESILMRIK
ncbi:AAA family ATPase [Candidatus Uhrbacteria bacterium]|nr:AAA family ATPase [Candidatus Uhrbacteria bacterium]